MIKQANSYPSRITHTKSGKNQLLSSRNKQNKQYPTVIGKSHKKNLNIDHSYIHDNSTQGYNNHTYSELELYARKIIKQYNKLNDINISRFSQQKSQISDNNSNPHFKKSIGHKLTKIYTNTLKIIYQVLLQKFVREVADQLVYILNRLVYFYQDQGIGRGINQTKLNNSPQVQLINKNIRIQKQKNIQVKQISRKDYNQKKKQRQNNTTSIRNKEEIQKVDRQSYQSVPSYHMPRLSAGNVKISLFNSPFSNSNQITPQPSTRTYINTQAHPQPQQQPQKNTLCGQKQKYQMQNDIQDENRPYLRIFVYEKLQQQYKKFKIQKQTLNSEIQLINTRIDEAYRQIQQKIQQNQMNNIILNNKIKQKNKLPTKQKNKQI